MHIFNLAIMSKSSRLQLLVLLFIHVYQDKKLLAKVASETFALLGPRWTMMLRDLINSTKSRVSKNNSTFWGLIFLVHANNHIALHNLLDAWKSKNVHKVSCCHYKT